MLMGLAPFNLPLDTRESARDDSRLYSSHSSQENRSSHLRVSGLMGREEREKLPDPGGESLPENWFLPLGCCGSIRDG
ncbi:MAG: hypothetical protein CMJ81_17035 [Planctomycetaceae bacterium]|nr:hypothetical protein [Planctomycetaceae bacterium]